MNPGAIVHARLANQRLLASNLASPAEVVAWLVAVQSQDYAAARWALGARLPLATDAAVAAAFDAGAILRTHVLRPTWHFVAPDDIRPLLTLTAPRVHQANGSMYRQLGLDAPTLSRSADVIVRALQAGVALTRDELKASLDRAGITASGGPDRAGQRLAYMVMHAELEGLIVSGARRGKQFTYMLLDERALDGRVLPREAALVEVSRRFFASHGPATAADFANWSGLTLTEARQGLDAVASELHSETLDRQTYWFATWPEPAPSAPAAFLLSIYDEYSIGYRDRSAIVSAADAARLGAMGNALQGILVLDGQIVGTWRRTLRTTSVRVELRPFRAFSDAEEAAIDEAIGRYGAFLELPAVRQ